MMDDDATRDTGRLALAIGCRRGRQRRLPRDLLRRRGPFGTINDIGNAATGVLSAGWPGGSAGRSRVAPATSPSVPRIVGAAHHGASVPPSSSPGTTGFFFAGLVSSVGFAGIGAWLVVAEQERGRGGAWPRGFGRSASPPVRSWPSASSAVPGIPLGLDDMATAPAWVWIGFLGWLGIFVVYPAWAIWLASVETRLAARADPARRDRRSPSDGLVADRPAGRPRRVGDGLVRRGHHRQVLPVPDGEGPRSGRRNRSWTSS